jgi:hypothetical protein
VVLNGYLKPIRHIVESTAEFVQRLRGIKPHPDAFTVRIDVSDFYMSGDAVSVARDASAIIPVKECRSLMDDVLLFLLSNQYVTSSLLPSRVWLTQTGSGMGLRHSGPASDAALFTRCERGWVEDEILHRHGIDMYVRFRDDDVWVLAHDRDAFKLWYWAYRRRADYYKVSVVEWSRSTVSMLQVQVWIDEKGFWTCPKFKVSSLGPPLHPSSAHPPGVHVRWPIAALKNYGSIGVRRRDAKDAKITFIERLKEYHTPMSYVKILENWIIARRSCL